MAIKDNVNDELKEKNEVKTERIYLKHQLMSSKKFASRKDVLNAILAENSLYTIAQAEKMIDSYMKGEVR